MKPCPTCVGETILISEGDGVDVAYTLTVCPTCHGEGWVRDPLVPRDRGVASYRPIQ